MGRLFWKFFLSIWLAQVTAMVGIGAAFWLLRQSEQQTQQHRPPHTFDAVIATLHHAGAAATRSLLAESRHRDQVFILDGAGQELLGRAVSRDQLAQHLERSRTVTSADGQTYTVWFEPPPAPLNWLSYGPPPGAHGPSFGPPPSGPPRPGPRPPPNPPPEWMHFLPIIGATLASLVFAALLAWHFSQPIRSMRAAFEQVANGKLDTRLGGRIGRRRDELADLGRDFDSMVQRLAALMDGQRRLLHDVSHELRSPLARLQVAVGLMRQQATTPDPQWDRVERETERMDQLVGQLLTLSRLEAGETGNLDELIEVDELLQAIVDDAQFEARQDGRIAAPAPTRITLRGRGELLHRAIENVVRNALKYTAASEPINLSVNLLPETLVIAVEDQGPGVPTDMLTRIFEPFHRNRSDGDGHGLGLAIAKHIVEAHGGRIYAENRHDGGLRVVLELPLETKIRRQ